MFNEFNIAPRFRPSAHAVVFEGDCRDMLRQIPTGTMQLVVTSPPYNLGKDVVIELLAMKSLQSNMSSGPGYYEGELYNIIRNGRGVPAVPLVLVGVEP